jgi:hypothetical protein
MSVDLKRASRAALRMSLHICTCGYVVAWVALAWWVAALRCGAQGGPPIELTPGTRTAKMHLQYARAADISTILGGTVIPLTEDRAARNPMLMPPPSYLMGVSANLLPDGIQSVTGLEVDNTLIIRYDTDDALRELRQIVGLLDRKARTVQVRATGYLTITSRGGKKRRYEIQAEGLSTDVKRVHLHSAIEGDVPRSTGATLVRASSEADVLAWPTADGTFELTTDWFVDIVWSAGPSGKPVRLRNTYRTEAYVLNRHTVTVTRAKLSLPDGTVELQLVLVPTLVDSPAPPPRP